MELFFNFEAKTKLVMISCNDAMWMLLPLDTACPSMLLPLGILLPLSMVLPLDNVGMLLPVVVMLPPFPGHAAPPGVYAAPPPPPPGHAAFLSMLVRQKIEMWHPCIIILSQRGFLTWGVFIHLVINLVTLFLIYF